MNSLVQVSWGYCIVHAHIMVIFVLVECFLGSFVVWLWSRCFFKLIQENDVLGCYFFYAQNINLQESYYYRLWCNNMPLEIFIQCLSTSPTTMPIVKTERLYMSQWFFFVQFYHEDLSSLHLISHKMKHLYIIGFHFSFLYKAIWTKYYISFNRPGCGKKQNMTNFNIDQTEWMDSV